MFIILSSLNLFNLLVYITGTNALKCAYFIPTNYYNEKLSNSSIEDNGAAKQSEHVEECAYENSFCYTLWNYDPYNELNASLFRIVRQGCWSNSKNVSCDTSQCISEKPVRALNNTNYCCCYGNMCNSNFTILNPLMDGANLDSVNNFFINLSRDSSFITFVFAFLFLIITVIIVFIICFRSIYANDKLLKNEKTIDSLHLLESQSLSFQSPPLLSSNFSDNDFEDLVFTEIIVKGKFATVWKGKLDSTTVAVKIFSKINKKIMINEFNIYTLPFMNHSSLPHFYGYKEKLTDNGNLEYSLVIEHGHFGSLQNYLKDHIFDWMKMCKLIMTLIRGVAYLHTEIFKDNKLKPSIAHRDLSSRNVIVKADGSCMISDFQFAVQFVNNKNPFLDRATSVGTVRYHSPEVLEGAINLLQCESSLKQSDIYALGLVLWEIASRCSDLYQGIEVPSYKLPYEQEVGLNPAFDQMKVLVGRHKARPLFPDIWKDSNPAIRLLKETIIECWDHEPEARLTSLCIEERSVELPLLWKRYKMETLSNCCVVASLQQQLKSLQNNLNCNNNIHHNHVDTTINNNSTNAAAAATNLENLCNHHQTSMLNDTSEMNKYLQNNCYINKFENSLHYKYNNTYHLLHHPYHNHHFYQHNSNIGKKQDLNNTMEKNLHAANLAAQTNLPKLTLPLQPHHARNPCIERNLMLDTSDEFAGLLEQGLKFQTKSCIKSNNSETSQEQPHNRSNELNYAENRALVRPLLPMPIPYVQNPVGTSDSVPPIKTKDINKYQNRNDLPRSAAKFNFLGIIKQKLSHIHLPKINSNKTENGNQNEEKILPDWDNNKNNKEGLFYSKETVPDNNAASSNTNTSTNNNSLVLNSSSLISPDYDVPFPNSAIVQKELPRPNDPVSTDCRLDNVSSSQKHLISHLEKLNNQIDNLDSFLISKIDEVQINETDDNLVEESQLLQTQAP